MNIEDNKKIKKIDKNATFVFKCDGCGNCCKNRDDILLNAHDIYRIRKYLNITFDEFLGTYCETYIGRTSKLPIVRLRAEPICVFLMHRKCLIQEAKPSVCALFPLGRYTTNKPWKTTYFLQNIECGTKDQVNQVEDWIKILGKEQEECTYLWASMLQMATDITCKISEPEQLKKWEGTIFWYLYLDYDVQKEFMPQLRERVDIIKQLYNNLFGTN